MLMLAFSSIGFGDFLPSGTGKAALFVAASNSNAKDKRIADFVCDGTDDEDTIQAAVDYIGSSGGIVRLAAGQYNICYKGVTVDEDNITISGVGEATIVKLADEKSSLLTANASSGQKDIVVADGSKFRVGQRIFIFQTTSTWDRDIIAGINGNTITMTNNLGYNYTTAAGATAIDIYNGFIFNSAINCTVEGIKFDGNQSNMSNTLAQSGFRTDTPTDGTKANDIYRIPIIIEDATNRITVRDCLFWEYYVNALLLWHGNTVSSEDNGWFKILNNRFETTRTQSELNFQTRAIAIEGYTRNSIVAGNQIYGGYCGIYVWGDGTVVANNVVNLKNSAYTTTLTNQYGIYANKCSYVSITGNTVKNSRNGIAIHTVNNSAIIGNTITGITSGIQTEGAATTNVNNVLANNTITGFCIYGIYNKDSNGGVSKSIISGNVIAKSTDVFDSSSKAIRDYGASNLISGNYIGQYFSGAASRVTGIGAGTIVKDNVGYDYETLTATGNAAIYGTTVLAAASDSQTITLPDGVANGQRKTFRVSDATHSVGLSVTNHVASAPEVFTFDNIDDYLELVWNGTKWGTIVNIGVDLP